MRERKIRAYLRGRMREEAGEEELRHIYEGGGGRGGKTLRVKTKRKTLRVKKKRLCKYQRKTLRANAGL